MWEKISETIGLYNKYIFINYKKFISLIVKRRNNNISKWFSELTENYKDLREKYNKYKNLKNISPLVNIWKIYEQKCKECYSKCHLLKHHNGPHQCFSDHHMCKKKCLICSFSKCKEKDCNLTCIYPLNHPDIHSCGHIHQCLGNCIYLKKTQDCKGRCILEYGYKTHKSEQEHFCGYEEHHCNAICSFGPKFRNCNKKCTLIYPHKKQRHNCGVEHLCIFICCLKKNIKDVKFNVQKYITIKIIIFVMESIYVIRNAH